MQFAHLLDKNGNEDKYYVSFKKGAKPKIINIPKEKTPVITECQCECDWEIKTIADLMRLANKYPIQYNVVYTNVNMVGLHKIMPYLQKINDMIALTNLKKTLVEQIVYYLQPNIDKTNDYKHTIISGPPGTGKTEIAKLLGSIFTELGVFGAGPSKFKKVTRSDLIAGYLGQTAIKTNEIIQSALGGVLFIDEAYALGNTDKKDTYSKECIDSLCESLSVHKGDLMVIIAGYEQELNECFFGYNQGLKSRFAWKFTIDGYSAKELADIFLTKLTQTNIPVHLSSYTMAEWFSKRMDSFPSFGRDIDTFVSKIKIAYSQRTFCKIGMSISIDDINAGYNMMCPVVKHKPNRELFFYS